MPRVQQVRMRRQLAKGMLAFMRRHPAAAKSCRHAECIIAYEGVSMHCHPNLQHSWHSGMQVQTSELGVAESKREPYQQAKLYLSRCSWPRTKRSTGLYELKSRLA